MKEVREARATGEVDKIQMSEKEEWKLTIQEVREKDWPTIKKKLYFRCAKCGKLRDFKVEGISIHVQKKCVECGHNEVMIPTQISMGRGSMSDVLMLGQMLGIPWRVSVSMGVKELTLELVIK